MGRMNAMEALRKLSHIRKNTLIVKGLEALNNTTVEVIIIPSQEDSKPDHKKLHKFRGVGESGFRDTSRRVDEILYGG